MLSGGRESCIVIHWVFSKGDLSKLRAEGVMVNVSRVKSWGEELVG